MRHDGSSRRNRSSHFIDNVGGVIPLAAGLSKARVQPKPKLLAYLRQRYAFQSVADFGCGRAGWLHAAKKIGVPDVHGFDLPELDLAERNLTVEQFTAVDLAEPLVLERRFDLCVSTEVSEHVPVHGIDHYFDSLVAAAPVVLFSGAVPYQGGLGHVNENWVEYWHGFFAARGYRCIDAFRDRFWHDASIPYYYRQNLFLYVDETTLPDFERQGWSEARNPKTHIHPDLYLKQVHRDPDRVLRERHRLDHDVRGFYGLVDDTVGVGDNQGYGTDSFRPRDAAGLIRQAAGRLWRAVRGGR